MAPLAKRRHPNERKNYNRPKSHHTTTAEADRNGEHSADLLPFFP
jgi:hypothetical protein